MSNVDIPGDSPGEPPSRDYFLSGKVYDFLKFIAQIVLPAFGTLYFTLASVWGFPAPEQVMATTLALGTFLGVVLRISTNSYNKSEAQYDGALRVIDREDGTRLFSLDLNEDTSVIPEKKNVNFKVDTSKLV